MGRRKRKRRVEGKWVGEKGRELLEKGRWKACRETRKKSDECW